MASLLIGAANARVPVIVATPHLLRGGESGVQETREYPKVCVNDRRINHLQTESPASRCLLVLILT